ncbi:hypothetical protein ACFV7Q_10035 [Streptomyces sp. NPDC059851]
MRLSSRHCDGLGTVPEDNCVPGGESLHTGDVPFEVVRKKASGQPDS